MSKTIFVVDNYDSFVYNIVQYIGEVEPDADVIVKRNDEVTVEDVEKTSPTHIVISPGPGRPKDAGMSVDVVKRFSGKIPILGVCLGHQAIGFAFGGKVVNAGKVFHGKTSNIVHSESGVFDGLPNPFRATRYHSLVVDRSSLPDSLVITAHSEDDSEIMGLQHREFPVFGVQFHPESILTEYGKRIIKNFLNIDSLRVSAVPVGKVKKENQMEASIKKVVEGENLTYEEAVKTMEEILKGRASDVQISAFLVGLRMKGETGDEVGGMAKVMQDYAVRIEAPSEKTADTCGTGGDGAGTFNISTTTAFVVSAGGIPVAKHGNRSVSSKVGSADVLEAGGYNLHKSPEEMKRELEETGFAFLFAPLLHPAMKEVMPVRRELKLRTVFNILGPIVNPARVKYQIVGVFNFDYAQIIARALQILGTVRSLVVSGGFTDELTTVSVNRAVLVEQGEMRPLKINPAGLKLHSASPSDLKGPDEPAVAFELMKKILSGEGTTAQTETVALNSGAVFWITETVSSLKEGVELALDLIHSRKALHKLEEVMEFQRKLGEV